MAMTELPPTMRSLVAPTYCKPAGYEIQEVPTPTIQGPNDILIQVHAAGIMTADTLMALPIKLGIVASGVVIATGSAVTTLRPGDAVYGMAFGRPIDYGAPPGFCAEYALGRADLFLSKPAHVAFEDAAALLGNVLTAVQSIELGHRLLGEGGREQPAGQDGLRPRRPERDGLRRRPAAEDGLRRRARHRHRVHVQGAAPAAPRAVDRVIDYQRCAGRLADAVPPGSVDLAYNTQFAALRGAIPLLRRDAGVVVSIAGVPPPPLLCQLVGRPLPLLVRWMAGLAQWWYAFLLWGTGVRYAFVSGGAGRREDLERAGEIIARGKVRALANVVRLEDIGAVREACQMVYTGKGGVGQLVVKVV
ncbi:hypothetical protein SLS62_000326 [Diatrype stigma]|uniref:Alcohol dehydrogenase-like N-terminal domain-containing protein n=1 Tax=Diatrype stigma TaxID=117547 RepID=A0AAN9V0R2_9PEZI